MLGHFWDGEVEGNEGHAEQRLEVGAARISSL